MAEIKRHISKSLLRRKGKNPHGGYRKWLRMRHRVRKSLVRF